MPFTDRAATVGGIRTAYVDLGPPALRPLVLLHGAGFDHAEMTWRGTMEALRGARRVIAPDLPGYGASADPPEPMGLADLGRWCLAFLDALGIGRADLAGVSMGGGLALWLAIHAPGRVGRIVPCGSYGIMPRLPLHGLARRLLSLGVHPVTYAVAARSRGLARWGLARTYADPSRVTEAAVDDLMAVAREQRRRHTFEGFLARELASGAGLAGDLTGLLPQVGAPVMLVHGLSDRIVPPRHARAAARLIPGCRLELLPAGHWPMRERPDLFLPLLKDFLGPPRPADQGRD